MQTALDWESFGALARERLDATVEQDKAPF
jgi:hypothetical protein